MRNILMIAAATCVLAGPALADEVVVRPPAAGVTVGETPRTDTERKTVIKKDEPGSQTTVIKKEHDDGTRSKTVIHHDNE
ncbi:hypothetical protein [Bradyrhizobium sp.]|uniref:hypothetical protein n=1 Tax=Bradyrhizobium sp. TaxID=376 RepID=UPI002D54D7F8|nr:hypothetical protein [Bradyrhizobium sp.]HZR72671.1 hypothetical protein [Bradyrhizobium sp.]